MITIASVSPERVCPSNTEIAVVRLLGKPMPDTDVADIDGFSARHFLSNDRAMTTGMIALET